MKIYKTLVLGSLLIALMAGCTPTHVVNFAHRKVDITPQQRLMKQGKQ